MSDWTTIKACWNGLNERGDAPFVAVTPPTCERYTQGEGHEDAAEEIADLALPSDTPYAVWHWQAHRFDRSGRLTGSNPIYFGGDREVVAARLATVPDGYRIEGGRGDGEAFLLLKNRDLHAVDPALEPDASELLGELRAWRPTPLSTDELAWCRRALSTAGASAELRRNAFGILQDAGALNETDLDAAVADLEAIWGARNTGAINALAAVLLEAERADGAELVDTIITESPDILTPGVLELRGGRAAADVAHRRALRGEDVVSYLRLAAAVRNTDPRTVAVELADEVARNDAARRALGRALPQAVAWRAFAPIDTDPDHEIRVAYEILTDDLLPAALRTEVAEAYDFVPARLTNRIERLSESPGTERLVNQGAGLRTRWNEAVESLRSSTPNQTWSGLDLTSKFEREKAINQPLTAAHIAWYRERLFDPATLEPGLGFCLGRLLSADTITQDDLDALLKGWKKRFAKAPDTYDRHLPGIVALGIALAETHHPGAAKFFDGVRGLKAKWASDVRRVLLGWYGAADDLDSLWAEAGTGSSAAAIGWSLLRARTAGISVHQAADEAATRARATGAFPYVARHFVTAAIAFGDPARRLWHYSFDEWTPAWFDRALDIADDTRLSRDSRRIAIELAESHHLIGNPFELRPPATVNEADAAKARLAAAERNLTA